MLRMRGNLAALEGSGLRPKGSLAALEGSYRTEYCPLPLLHDKMQTVEDVGFGGAGVKIKRKDIHLGVEFFYPFFYTFGNHMVSNTSEGLEAEHIVHSVLGKVGNFSGNEPAFAKVGRQVDDLTRRLRILEQVGERPVISVATANPVELA